MNTGSLECSIPISNWCRIEQAGENEAFLKLEIFLNHQNGTLC